ncbi:hypothetical protein JOC95_004380 [Bacillus tianshenii]|uniref:Uncharacterized protein n=1 Tax=Sutcliffiella tianshenii TaxID=1463404 RepID=A0ABS2P7T1_9BACI|nr:hypothetical protein [Bacillus tianshenii]
MKTYSPQDGKRIGLHEAYEYFYPSTITSSAGM